LKDDVDRRGFTLVECLVVLAVAAILAGLTLPSLRGRELRVARLDAVAALMRLQVAQERYRSHHGDYSGQLSALAGVQPTSPQGRYTLSLQYLGPETYQAAATAVGEQQRDTGCAAITLDVRQGFASQGPRPDCWGR
jgi:type IV pilus assembly protein PilE